MKKLLLSLLVALGFALPARRAANEGGYPWDKFPPRR